MKNATPTNHPYPGDISQHEEYAITGKVDFDQDFGVLKHNHKDRPVSEPFVHRKPALKESARAHPKPKGFHQHPNHGPDGHDGP